MNEDFRDRNLQGFSFRGQDLAGADFSNANLRGVDFTSANLTDANFMQACLGVQNSWVVGITVLIAIAIVVTLLFTSSIAGVAIGLNVSSGTFVGIFAAIVCPTLLALFADTLIRHGLERSALVMFLATIVTGIGIFLIALAGGISGFVPKTGVAFVARSLVGGLTGVMMADGIAAGILILSAAMIVVGQTSWFGAGTIMLIAAVMLMVNIPAGVLMSAAMNAQGSPRLLQQTPAPTLVEPPDFLTNQPAPLVWKQLLEMSGAHTGTIATISTILITGLTVGLSFYVTWRILANPTVISRVRRFAVTIAARQGTRFQGATLERANFTKAIVKNADFTKANLTRTNWRHTQLLHRARIERTYLENASIRQLVETGKGQNQNYDNQDLQGLNLKEADLRGASFIDANLYQADLEDANLSGALLVRTQLDSANLQRACLTGACIKNWGITKATELARVKCDSVFLDYVNAQPCQRSPLDRDFKRGEFLAFLRPYLNSTDFQHDRELDPKAAAIALSRLAQQHQESIEVVGIEKHRSGVSLKINLLDNIRSATFQQEYQAYYQQVLQIPSSLPENVAAIALQLEQIQQELTSATQLKQVTLNHNKILILGGVKTMQTNRSNSELSILLSQLRAMLQTLPTSDQEDALEQLQTLAEFENQPEKAIKNAIRILRGMSLSSQQSDAMADLLQKIEQETLTKLSNPAESTSKAPQTHIENLTNNGGMVGTFNGGTINFNQGKYSFRDPGKVQIIENLGTYHEHNYAVQQNLVQARQDIQQLLDQLAQRYPNPPDSETATREVKHAIAQSPTLRARLVGALKAGGTEALKAIFEHKAISITVETIKGFLEAE